MAVVKGNSATWTKTSGKWNTTTMNVIVSEYYDTSTGKFYVGVDTVQILDNNADWGFEGYYYYLHGTITAGGHTILNADSSIPSHGSTGWFDDHNVYHPFGNLDGTGASSNNSGWIASCSSGASYNISINLQIHRPSGYTDGDHGATFSGSTTLSFKHPTGHTNTATGNLRSAATCTAAATYWYKCAGCGTQSTSYFSLGSALGHIEVNGGTASVHKRCSRCNETLSSAHSYSSSVHTAATCTKKGITKYSCGCGYSYTSENINALGHKEVNVGTAAVHTKCSTCGTILSTTHSYTVDSGVQYAAASCTTPRYNYKKCSCEYNPKSASYIISTGTALGHDYDEIVIEPTCTTQGYTSYQCTRCSDTSKANDNYTAALGHNYGDGMITQAPTYTKPGTLTYTCSRCSDYYTEALARKQGAVRIKTATGYRPHLAYVRNSVGWALCVPNVCKSKKWNSCG
jgi:DNA-directed RNA polymerase subunit RPC12/RpoP